jgi:hypothetical protein
MKDAQKANPAYKGMLKPAITLSLLFPYDCPERLQ